MPPKLMSPGTHSSAVGKEAINKITSNSPGDECSGGSRSSRVVLGGGAVLQFPTKGFSVNLSV